MAEKQQREENCVLAMYDVQFVSSIPRTMPPLEPSLYALYKQGRFRKHGPLVSNSDDVMQQTERFAVAMVAFALKHDDHDFCGQFLKYVCDLRNRKSSGHPTISIEIDGCGDLELQHDNDVFFIEFKIESPLQPNQDPTQMEFATIGGYGRNIDERCKKMAKCGTYIVLQEKIGTLTASRNPRCLSKTWEDIYRCGCPSRITRDLFHSLGLLNVKPFTHMITKDYRLGQSAHFAGQVYKVLEAVAEESHFRRPKWEATADGKYAGMNFFAASSPEAWRKLVKPKGEIVGWYGYENGKLEVCFYCGTPEAAQQITKRLIQAFPENKSSDFDGKNVAFITLESHKSRGDQDWFVSVFERLIRKSSLG